MIAYTGIETVSNLAEEARDPVRTIPRSIGLVAVAVFAIYFTLPLVALSALPVEMIDGELTTLLALPPEEGGYAERPDPRRRGQPRRSPAWLLDVLQIYVGILAATILFIATNAGIIGASRITYSMALVPAAARGASASSTRSFKTPWLSLVVFAGFASILVHPAREQSTFLGTMYSFGAMLSFTVAHASIVRLRMKRPRGGGAVPGAAEPPARRRRLAGVRVRRRDRDRDLAWLVIVVQDAADALGRARAGWRSGSSSTSSTAGACSMQPLTETVRAPPAVRPGASRSSTSTSSFPSWQESRRARRCTWRRGLPPSGARRSSPCA